MSAANWEGRCISRGSLQESCQGATSPFAGDPSSPSLPVCEGHQICRDARTHAAESAQIVCSFRAAHIHAAMPLARSLEVGECLPSAAAELRVLCQPSQLLQGLRLLVLVPLFSSPFIDCFCSASSPFDSSEASLTTVWPLHVAPFAASPAGRLVWLPPAKMVDRSEPAFEILVYCQGQAKPYASLLRTVLPTARTLWPNLLETCCSWGKTC